MLLMLVKKENMHQRLKIEDLYGEIIWPLILELTMLHSLKQFQEKRDKYVKKKYYNKHYQEDCIINAKRN